MPGEGKPVRILKTFSKPHAVFNAPKVGSVNRFVFIIGFMDLISRFI
jgi:hypothetical protein